MPRIGAFWRAYPEIILNQVISDNVSRFRLSTIDLRIRYCNSPEPDEEGARLFGDTVYPVCSPEFFRSMGQ